MLFYCIVIFSYGRTDYVCVCVRVMNREAVVEELSILGARVHTCARDETQLQERLREWQEKGFQVTTSICDVSLREQREKLMETVSSLFQGKLNILVSVYILASPPRAWDLQEPNHVVFLITFFFCSRLLFPSCLVLCVFVRALTNHYMSLCVLFYHP